MPAALSTARMTAVWAALFGLGAIMAGAFGAHGLKGVLTAEGLATFETAARYQMYMALFLLASSTVTYISDMARQWITALGLAGTVLFCGSLYALALQPITGFGFAGLALLTPIGGLVMMMAWGGFIWAALSGNNKSDAG